MKPISLFFWGKSIVQCPSAASLQITVELCRMVRVTLNLLLAIFTFVTWQGEYSAASSQFRPKIAFKIHNNQPNSVPSASTHAMIQKAFFEKRGGASTSIKTMTRAQMETFK